MTKRLFLALLALAALGSTARAQFTGFPTRPTQITITTNAPVAGGGTGSSFTLSCSGCTTTSTALSGDLSGTIGSPVVAGLQSRALSASAPSDGQGVGWSQSGSTWQPTSFILLSPGSAQAGNIKITSFAQVVGVTNTGQFGCKYNIQAGTTYTTIFNDCFIGMSNSSARTVTLAAASGTAAGQWLTIKDANGNAATNNVTIAPNGTDTIDGVNASKTINTNYGSIRLVCNGSNGWFTQ